MDINLELIKKIISSDELCDKVNSSEYKESYKSQIEDYILLLCNDSRNVNFNIEYINRYLKKFVVNNGIKEDVFFDNVLLKLYRLNINNSEFNSILDCFNFNEVKELLIQRYNQNVINNNNVSNRDLVRMLSFYCYVCPNYLLPNSYIDYLTYHLVSKNVSLNYELISYYYRSFSLYFSSSKGLNLDFEILEHANIDDPYYDKRKNVVIYKQSISDKIDYNILADIFYQIKYLFLVKCISDSNNNCYSFDQLRLVKEICLNTMLGNDYFDKNYCDISFSNDLKKQSRNTVRDYYSSIGLNVSINTNYEVLSISNHYDDFTDKAISVDILFDLTLKHEHPNLLRSLIKNYPILACEYKSDKRKSILDLLLDIYSNRRLLDSFNKDLEWYNSKLGNGEDEIIVSKIERLNNKISICSSYINVMSLSINNGDMVLYDLVRSISDLITYDTTNQMIQNDIIMILNSVIPKKIKRLCSDRNSIYKENFKQKIIRCYIDSMGLVRNNFDSDYFMKIYSSLELCIKAFEVD